MVMMMTTTSVSMTLTLDEHVTAVCHLLFMAIEQVEQLQAAVGKELKEHQDLKTSRDEYVARVFNLEHRYEVEPKTIEFVPNSELNKKLN
jgi:hypothetical protein